MKYLLITLLILKVIYYNANASEEINLKAYTDKDGRRVVLIWQAVEGVTKYNLYRREVNREYSLIAQDISVMKDCDKINELIPVDSAEYKLIEGVFEINEKKEKIRDQIFRDWLKLEDFKKLPLERPDLPLLGPGQPDLYLYICGKMATILPDSNEFKKLQELAQKNWKVAVLIGQGYEDTTIRNGITYNYKICAGNTRECSEVTVTAGRPIPPKPPKEISIQAGDNEVLIYWPIDRVEEKAVGFKIYRKKTGGASSVGVGRCEGIGEEVKVNEGTDVDYIAYDLNGRLIEGCYQRERKDGNILPKCFGFTDTLQFAPSGELTTHTVDGKEICGPQNGYTYCYQVSSVDLLGNEGEKSKCVTAAPQDTTPPLPPNDVMVIPHEQDNALEIRWTKVLHDIKGRIDEIAGYNVYRYDKENVRTATRGTKINRVLIRQPTDEATIFVTVMDTSPNLRSTCGIKPHYYRVRSIDSKNNESEYSEPAVEGSLKDITPPQVPKNLSTKSDDTKIYLTWDLNTDCDIEGYLIYRSYCEFGRSACVEIKKERCVEYVPFQQIGYISHEEAKNKKEVNPNELFVDTTIPGGSPLCYAYLIKAQDASQNVSGGIYRPGVGVVNLTREEEAQIKCDRLRDKTPPQPPIISGLQAQPDGILIEWIGAPIQDIKAYHVYRAEEENEPYVWVGGKTVPLPDSPAETLTKPYNPPPDRRVGCNDIPLQLNEDMSRGEFLDKRVNPKQIYWYKVVGIDQAGNETDLEKAVPISTFTYATPPLPVPIITSISVSSEPCGLLIRWQPEFDGQKYIGFVVFRSRRETGPYYQISSIITDDSYTDTKVVKGIEYWYKVLLVNIDGNTTPLSFPKSGKM